MTSTTPTIQSASLHFREGNSDKVYHAAIEPKGEGYIVTFAYGRRGKPGNHSAALQKVIQCDQTAIRRECLVTAAQVKLPARRQEFEIQFSFNQWVNQ